MPKNMQNTSPVTSNVSALSASPTSHPLKPVDIQEVMNAAEIQAALERMADALIAQLDAPENAAIIGIRTGGVPLGLRLKKVLEARLSARLTFGVLDITLYRDDLYSGLEKPRVGPTDVTFSLDNREIVLVDDVLFTGRTVRAALNELMDLGRPRRILLATLLDRGHRELPIMANAVGLHLETLRSQKVEVQLTEDPRFQQDQVLLLTAATRV